MVYKYASVFNIVEKLYRDYDHQEELDIWDVIEWAGEALEFIGAGQQYATCIEELTIVNSQALLPCNFHSDPHVAYNGSPLRYSTGAFSPLTIDTTTSTTNVINGQAVSKTNFPATGNQLGGQGKILDNFYIRDGVLVTSIGSGTVVLQYRGTKVDKNGYPMIPDLQSYRTAVATYCQWKMDHKDARKGRISAQWATKSEADWHWYCKQARGVANMPNLVYMEAMKDQWVKLKPNQNAADSFYQDATIREMRKLK